MNIGKRFDYRALGRLKTGQMNGTERAYAAHLEDRKYLKEVLWYKFEGIKLRLADNTFYTADFAVMLANFELEMHEVKGFMLDDANSKIKIAADTYPLTFKIIKKAKGGQWEISEV